MMTTTKTTTGRAKLIDQACQLFGVTADKVPTVMWAIGLRETCGRCGGSGRYSYNQIHGDRCYGCNGRGEVAAKLSKSTFQAAVVKVAAGELDAARARARAKREARKAIAPLVARAKEIYGTIGGLYETAYQATRGSWDPEQGCYTREIPESLHRAQIMNNAIFYGNTGGSERTSITAIQWNVQNGRRTDYVEAKAEIEEAIAMLETLRAEWARFTTEV